jgi:hypothetical protein
MYTRVPSMLQCAQDLSLKCFIASHCVTRQLKAEGSTRGHEEELTQRVAELEKEKWISIPCLM